MPETLFGLMCFSGFTLLCSHGLSEALLCIITINNNNNNIAMISTQGRGKKHPKRQSLTRTNESNKWVMTKLILNYRRFLAIKA